MQQADKPIYRLYAIVEHHGSMTSGHYVAYVRAGRAGGGGAEEEEEEEEEEGQVPWYHISDASVKQVNPQLGFT